MKAKLAEVTQDAPSAEIVDPEVLQRHFAKFDEAFFTFCSKGLNFDAKNTYLISKPQNLAKNAKIHFRTFDRKLAILGAKIVITYVDAFLA